MRRVFPWLVAAMAIGGCRQDMHDAPRYEAYEKSEFFGDARSMRPQVADTVARGQLREDAALFTGKVGTALVAGIPLPITGQLVHRGRQRFDIFCSPCHGRAGLGDGMVVRRGYRVPPSLHVDRLRAQPDGYFYDVITNGFGVMPDYASQIPVADRWAIVAYVRALQLSQHAPLSMLPARTQELVRAEGGMAAPPAAAAAAAAAEGHHP
jgi:mono/diheme cytochrome c family protein